MKALECCATLHPDLWSLETPMFGQLIGDQVAPS
jgi:hypothetical protein